MTEVTQEVRAVFHSVPCPNPRFVVDLVEYPAYPGLVFVQTYEPIIQSLTMAEKIEFAQYLYAVRDAIAVVVPCDLIKRDRMPPDFALVRHAREQFKRRRETDGM